MNKDKIIFNGLKKEIKVGDKLYITSAVFSMYGFDELREELKLIDGFDFIFTNG